jgi:hypothetical protein
MKGKGKYFQKRTITIKGAAELTKEAKIKDLHSRRSICQAAIKIVDEATEDPRRAEALKHYQGQLAEIDRQITELTGKPPDIVIGLQAGVLTAKSEL